MLKKKTGKCVKLHLRQMAILLVDSYDSFTNNLRNLVQEVTNDEVIIIPNDKYNLPHDQGLLEKLLDRVNAVIIGPGPGSPSDVNDIGIIPTILGFKKMPILGVCLGFQCMCIHYGGTINYLNEPVHGQIARIQLDADHDRLQGDANLFQGFPNEFDSVRYHSIYVDQPGDMIALAHCDGILMAAAHKKYPHYGVQYHPESICSQQGQELIRNFWSLAKGNIKPQPMLQMHQLTLTPSQSLQFKRVANCNPIDACEQFEDFLLLNSASQPGDWSIVGLPIPNESDVISHSTTSGEITLSKWKAPGKTVAGSIWTFLHSYMKERMCQPYIENSLLSQCPFVGGLVGFISYEEGCYVQPPTESIPDMKLCFIERFIAIKEGSAFIVSIKDDDMEWIQSTAVKFIPTTSGNEPFEAEIMRPQKEKYFEQFDQCQKYLHLGDSYELCLTTEAKVMIPNTVEPWQVYKTMVAKNPSPYSAYLDFGDSRLLSTSPERFLSWDTTTCEMRPIKGTVKKDGVDYDQACKLLKIPKEMGENLMIVDLIRHDLYEHLANVRVTQLMQVEEYHTVYQLVSVIRGDRIPGQGIEILEHALPPGSMTGAPKKRSVELLQQIERRNRGIYSGVAGYWSVNDNADWSVVIRSLYQYGNDSQHTDTHNCYRCGAGGAITVLSTAQGEWDELNVKLDSVLHAL